MCNCQSYTGIRTLGSFWYQEEEPQLLIGLLTTMLQFSLLQEHKINAHFSTRETVVVFSLIEYGILD